MRDRQLIAYLLSALGYRVKQTRPIEFIRVVIEAAREYLKTSAQSAQAKARPYHVFNVTKSGALTAWEPTAMAFALPDGKHALYTAPQQAEAVQYTRADLDRAYSAGLVEGERLAIQQAEAVPPDVARDAERYRWLRNESWAGYNTGKGTPSVYTVDGAGNRRMMLAEEAMDEAIDAAIAQQKGGV